MRKTYLGTLYYGASDNFQRGLYRIARCLKAENHDLAVVEMIKLGVDTVNEENTIVKQASKLRLLAAWIIQWITLLKVQTECMT